MKASGSCEPPGHDVRVEENPRAQLRTLARQRTTSQSSLVSVSARSRATVTLPTQRPSEDFQASRRAGPTIASGRHRFVVAELRQAYEIAKTITKPGIYFTGAVFLCNQTRGTTTIDENPYAYS